jgi:hypothetical protein
MKKRRARSERKPKVANCDLKKRQVDPTEFIKHLIFVVRGQRVMLDRDLAGLYGVTTKRLNQQLRRNRNRFPQDFAFQLTLKEAKEVLSSRLQNATLKKGQNIKHAPHVFTEHGAIMLATVLNSSVAVRVSVHVVRAFVQMRSTLMEYAHLALRIEALEEQYDGKFKMVFDAIRQLISTPNQRKSRIGFVGGNHEPA